MVSGFAVRIYLSRLHAYCYLHGPATAVGVLEEHGTTASRSARPLGRLLKQTRPPSGASDSDVAHGLLPPPAAPTAAGDVCRRAHGRTAPPQPTLPLPTLLRPDVDAIDGT
jgi:hypothetical protein